MPVKASHPVDQYVGGRIRMRRIMLGVSQGTVGAALGLSFQQIQKYEKGLNRVSASRLQQFAQVLQVPLSFFFEGAPNPQGHPKGSIAAPSPAYVTKFLSTSDGLALTKAFMAVKNAKLRRSIVDLVKEIAGEDEP